ncbi:MAG: N-acetyl-gamma-glutamyl-phosphate reductase [Nitrospirae bacterium RBG_13_39_12]|nr:MAG: N-acetyl-gamma-glutamyl-phosphate reductase [Nitrospirae bacterium RBG_13_39_12]
MVNVVICGGSGYTGGELLRILSGHPHITITAVTSEKSAGKKVVEVFPHLHKYNNLIYEPLNKEKLLNKADMFFLALPHGTSQETVNFLFSKNKKVIDLSADYRLNDPKVYKKWYGLPHKFLPALKKAVYGLPEVYRSKIKKAGLIANPGCYPTGAILGLIPALKNELIDVSSIIIDSKSGVSGAGRKADLNISYCEVNEGFRAYAIGTHRHIPEIEQELSLLYGKKIVVNFSPHLVPVDRGILTTIYAPVAKKKNAGEILRIYTDAYRKEPFVRVLDYGLYPNIKNIRGTNICEIGLKLNELTNTLIVVTAIDNLVKGASGQAVQNMNIMMGIDEKTSLDTIALFP